MTVPTIAPGRVRLHVLLSLSFLTLALACSHPHPNVVTPAGQAALKADEVVLRVNELMNTAIQAEANGGLETVTAYKIVQYCVMADQTLKGAPQGWQGLVKSGWAATKATLPPITNPTVLLAISTFEAVLGRL